MCLISWERTQKRDPHNFFFGGIFGVKNGVPNGPFSATKIATPSACYRGPKPQKRPKWLLEGAKVVLDPGSKGLPRVFCTTKTLLCTGVAPPKPCFAPVQLCFAPLEEAFGTLSPKDLLHPLLATFANFSFSGPPRIFASQH